MAGFGPRHYVPALKGKKGEFDALGSLPDPVKDACTPLVEVVPVPWDWDNDVPTKDLHAHLDSFAANLGRGWGSGREIFVDSLWIEPDELVNGIHHLEYLFGQLRGQTEAIPAGGLSRGPEHTAAVARIAALDGLGAALRLDSDDVGDAALATAINTWLSDTQLSAEQVDLIVDLGELNGNSASLLRVAAQVVLSGLPHLRTWRSLTVLSGAFPQFLAEVDAESEDTFIRHDWQLWSGLLGRLLREPSFGDYAIAHPALLDVDARNLRPSAGIRHTTPTNWLIVKRRWIRHGHAQFQDASRILTSRPEFAGSGHCAGCTFITACAAGGATGNLTTWRRVGSCHHIVMTTSQLAQLP